MRLRPALFFVAFLCCVILEAQLEDAEPFPKAFVQIFGGYAPGIKGTATNIDMLYSQYDQPLDIFYDGVTDAYFVADTENQRIQVTNLQFYKTETLATMNHLHLAIKSKPLGITADARGKKIYVTSTCGRVWYVHRTGGRKGIMEHIAGHFSIFNPRMAVE